MRSWAVVVASIACALAVDAAASPRHPRPAPAPISSAASASGVAALRAPESLEVLGRGGTFTMGSTDVEVAHAVDLCKHEAGDDDRDCNEILFQIETPAHDVSLSDYWIDRTEVTVARYRACVRAGRCAEPPYSAGATRFDRPELPVVLVSHTDATTFCAWAGGRLPTEAEWERAARGLAGRRYPWGNVYNPFLSNHGKVHQLDDSDGFLELAPAGSFPEGRTPDGIADLAGNVGEWVSDWFEKEYPKASELNPKGPDQGDFRVFRGGDYGRPRAWVRSAARLFESPGVRRPYIGFRCVRPVR